MKAFSTGLGLICGVLMAWGGIAAAAGLVRGFTLTEIGNHLYDVSEDLTSKTEAQIVVDRLFALGVRHINLSPRAVMHDPRQSFVTPVTDPAFQQNERARYLRFISYLHQLGMTVGIRPIVFVVDAFGNSPYIEPLPGGGQKIWWHGNIQPSDPAAWFQSFVNYLDIYLEIARSAGVEEFTIGAELESMTVGAQTAWPANPFGFPTSWLSVLAHAREVLPLGTREAYDINFADDPVLVAGAMIPGAELANWRRRIAYSSPTTAEEIASQKALIDFYRGLDTVGVDMYRSLATQDEILPEDYDSLVALLRPRTDGLVGELSKTLSDINGAVGTNKSLLLKEVGFKSVDRGFVNPFIYSGTGEFNSDHQAAAYEAVLSSFFSNQLPWFLGLVFWDTSVDLTLHGPFDLGFSPLGKAQTESVISHFFH